MDILITNGLILSAVGGISDNSRPGWIHIQGDKIEGMGNGIPPDEILRQNKFRSGRMIDAKGGLVLPAFTNAHTHLAQSFSRVLSTQPRLEDWLKKLHPMRKAMSADDVFLATRLSLIENLRCGIGTVADHFKYTNSPAHFDGALSAAEKSGMRVLMVRGFRERNPSGYDGLDGAMCDLSRSTKFLGNGHGRVSLGIGPTTLQYCSPEMVKSSAFQAKELGIPYHLHIAETIEEVVQWSAKTGMRPVEWFYRNQLLGPMSQLVHCVHLNDSEISKIASTNALVVHCPVSNLMLKCGAAPVASFLRHGIRLAVATDGQGSNGGQNIFESLKLAALLGSQIGEDITYDPISYLKMGFQTVFPDKTPSSRIGLAVGMPGDLTILNIKTLHTIPSFSLASAVIYSMNSTNVRNVIVNGEILLDDGRVTIVNEAELFDECEVALRRLGVTVG